MKIRVFYAGIPTRNKNKEKELVLDNFYLGGRNRCDCLQVRNPIWEPCDLAVMQGWVHANSGRTPHLMFRRQIIEQQKKINKHTLAIDSNLFLYRDPGNIKTYLRFSLNDVFPTTGNYFTDNVDPMRWQKLKHELGIELQPWTNKGKHILLCLQRQGGWSMAGTNVMDWCRRTIESLQMHTSRQIVVRAHPGDKKANEYLRLNYPNVKISQNKSILNDFHKCWAVVTYNSSPGVAAAIEGIPVFVTDPNPQLSQAYDICNTDLSTIDNPIRPDRQQWIEKLAMSHFSFSDLKSGAALDIIQDYVC
jgi:hypothetical protein